MSASTTTGGMKSQLSTKRLIGVAAVVVLLVAMALDTAVVPIGASVGSADKFSPDAFGEQKFPEIRDIVAQQAVPAAELATAITQDKQAAVDEYAIASGAMPIMAVKLSGVVGEGQLGTFEVQVDGVPDAVTIKVQTGPAVIGTALRDSDPSIGFGDFTNQIEYQNAAAGINNAMKKVVLSDLERDQLGGKTITVVGAFKLINPKSWRVTPAQLSVQQ